MAVNILLALAQLIGGVLAHSQALIADGLHTVSDLVSDFVVLLASRHAHRAADSEHPYGHGRIETLATSILGLILIAVAVGIALDVIQRLLHPETLLTPGPLALAFAALAVLAKEGLYRYTVRVARKVRSSLLEANAWHHRSDAVSSLIVIAGIAGSLAGIRNLDAIAALAVTVFIGHIGWKLLWRSGQELIDASLDEETLNRIKDVINHVDGVVNMHFLRTRKSGGDAFADVHIQVPAKISVSEGHQISEAVRKAIIENVDEITDVTIHTDAEDDAAAKPCGHLPLRGELIQSLEQAWSELEIAGVISKLGVHYLDGKIHLELYLPGMYAEGHAEACRKLRKVTLEQPYVAEAEIYFTQPEMPTIGAKQ